MDTLVGILLNNEFVVALVGAGTVGTVKGAFVWREGEESVVGE